MYQNSLWETDVLKCREFSRAHLTMEAKYALVAFSITDIFKI